MRILVNYLLKGEKVARAFEVECNLFICVVGIESGKLTCFLGQDTLCVNRNNDGKLLILAANFKVVNTETGCCMNATCTTFECNVVTDNKKRLSVEEGMLGGHKLKLTTV